MLNPPGIASMRNATHGARQGQLNWLADGLVVGCKAVDECAATADPDKLPVDQQPVSNGGAATGGEKRMEKRANLKLIIWWKMCRLKLNNSDSGEFQNGGVDAAPDSLVPISQQQLLGDGAGRLWLKKKKSSTNDSIC